MLSNLKTENHNENKVSFVSWTKGVNESQYDDSVDNSFDSDPFGNVAGPYFQEIMDIRTKIKSNYEQLSMDKSSQCLVSATKAPFSDRNQMKTKEYMVQ